MTTATIVFMTARQDPRLEWVLENLAEQTTDADNLELMVVDFFNRPLSDHDKHLAAKVAGLTSWRVVPPMPCIWQGEYRVTKDHWWATSSARNGALVLAKHDYVAFLDDRCHLGPKWMECVRRYEAQRTAVLVGSYDKYEDGGLVSTDHRRGIAPNGKRNCHAGWLYGCSFALPLSWALEVNGFEDGCNGLTGEDYIFGLMLANADHVCDFVPDMFVRQDRSQGNVTCKGTYRCMDKGVSPNDKSHAALDRFGARSRTEFTPNLLEMRTNRLAAEAAGEPWSFPVPNPGATFVDWYDGQDIRTMV